MTTTAPDLLRDVADRADPNSIADALRKARMGRHLDPLKITLAAITASATVDLTSFRIGDATVTQNQGGLATNETLPPLLALRSLRVTTVGTATAGTRVLTDDAGALIAPDGAGRGGVARISDDGKTLTFEGTVTGLIIEYLPRSATPTTDVFLSS